MVYLLCWLVTLAFYSELVLSGPNLVWIVADDLGYNDVGFHNPDVKSPNIDHLAQTGIKLNQSYVQPLCSPSRTAFMTGIYPFPHLVIQPGQAVCVPLNITMFPEVLKQNGYKTHAVGKWHLGFCNWACTPTFRGFDSFYGFYNGGEDFYTKQYLGYFDFRFNTSVHKQAKGGYSTVPQKYLDMYAHIDDENRRNFSGMVTSMDDAVGRVVTALKEKGIYNNTLIFFTSDPFYL
ncbi:unnamed protein product, partial [Candidula unifasciata]